MHFIPPTSFAERQLNYRWTLLRKIWWLTASVLTVKWKWWIPSNPCFSPLSFTKYGSLIIELNFVSISCKKECWWVFRLSRDWQRAKILPICARAIIKEMPKLCRMRAKSIEIVSAALRYKTYTCYVLSQHGRVSTRQDLTVIVNQFIQHE